MVLFPGSLAEMHRCVLLGKVLFQANTPAFSANGISGFIVFLLLAIGVEIRLVGRGTGHRCRGLLAL